MRETLRVLEAMGVVRRGVGSGPDAGAVVVAEPSAAISSMLRLHLATDLAAVRVIEHISGFHRTALAARPGEDAGMDHPGSSEPMRA